MLNNSWFKKEMPLLGLTGVGGGVGSNLVAGLPVDQTTGGYAWKVVGDDSHEYQYHMWLTGSPAPEKEFTVNETITSSADVLVVGGGGGGGGYSAGGGGAGGVLYAQNMTLNAAASVSVGVGAVVSAGANWSNPGQNGNSSDITLNGVNCPVEGGGYGGGAESDGASRPKASGGGGSRGPTGQAGGTGAIPNVPTPGGTLTGYAYNGAQGAPNQHPNYAGGGGGGSRTKGAKGGSTAMSGGSGGQARYFPEFAGGLITPTDVPAVTKKVIGGGAYAAGGGGGKENSPGGDFSTWGGSGGTGGGGQGGFWGIEGQDGLNFGCGGGGGGQSGPSPNSGNAGGMGAAGIVMVRYPLGVKQTATGASLSGGTENTPGNGYKYHTFTSNGTLTVPGPGAGQVEVLLIGAGGGGASSSSCCVGQGGGGAGGCLHGVLTLTAGSYPIAIGAGSPAGSGGNTTFAGFTGYGGGRGGYYNGTYNNAKGVVGGCSGGHAHNIADQGGSNPTAWTYATKTMSPGPDNPARGELGLLPTQAPQTQPYGTLTGYGSAGGQGCQIQAWDNSNAAIAGGGGGIGGAGSYGTPGLSDYGWPGGSGGPGRAFPGFPGPGIGVPALGPTGLLGGGGGASGRTNYPSNTDGADGGPGGGGQGAPSSGGGGNSGTANTGSGGGGGNGGPAPSPTGPSGGTGLVVIRYKV